MGVVTPSHGSLLVNQVFHNVAAQLLVQGAQAGVQEDPTKSAHMLAGAVVILDRPLLEGFAVHGSRHHPVKKPLTIPRDFLLFIYVGTQLFNKTIC